MLDNIDRALINALIQPDQYGKIGKDARIKGIVRKQIIDYDTEVDISEKRTADILLIVPSDSKQLKVVIEVENDHKPDVAETLRKLKRDKRYPTIVIIPKELEKDAYRFQKSGFYVWYWTATCRWLCQECNGITTSTSSITPSRCTHCKKGANFLQWTDPENVDFKEAENNPTTTYEEYARKHAIGVANITFLGSIKPTTKKFRQY